MPQIPITTNKRGGPYLLVRQISIVSISANVHNPAEPLDGLNGELSPRSLLGGYNLCMRWTHQDVGNVQLRVVISRDLYTWHQNALK